MADVRKHILLANDLRKDILSGRYGIEGGLPGPNELARRSGYSRVTVNSALSLLEGERLIIKRDVGYYVNSPITTIMTQYVMPIAVRMRKYARTGHIKNVGAVERVDLPEYLAEKLELKSPVAVVFQPCVSVEVVDETEKPMQIARYYYFMPLTDDQVQRMDADASYDVLLESPVHLSRRDEIFPRLPTEEEAKLLSISNVMPVLSVLSTVLDEDGNILLFQDLTRVPHAILEYRYSFENRPK